MADVQNNGRSTGGCTGKGWLPGQSGNPAGRPRALKEVVALARQHSDYALSRLVDLLDSKDESIVIRAAEAVLARAWGPPTDIDLVDRLTEAEDRLARAREDA